MIDVSELVKLINRKMESDGNDASEQNGSAQSGDGVRHRRKSYSSTNGSMPHAEDTTDNHSEPEYTPEQAKAVKRYENCQSGQDRGLDGRFSEFLVLACNSN